MAEWPVKGFSPADVVAFFSTATASKDLYDAWAIPPPLPAAPAVPAPAAAGAGDAAAPLEDGQAWELGEAEAVLHPAPPPTAGYFTDGVYVSRLPRTAYDVDNHADDARLRPLTDAEVAALPWRFEDFPPMLHIDGGPTYWRAALEWGPTREAAEKVARLLAAPALTIGPYDGPLLAVTQRGAGAGGIALDAMVVTGVELAAMPRTWLLLIANRINYAPKPGTSNAAVADAIRHKVRRGMTPDPLHAARASTSMPPAAETAAPASYADKMNKRNAATGLGGGAV